MTGVPLVIDLDGTLLRSDLLQESTLKLLADAPQHLLSLPGWLYTGKAHLKRQVAQRVTLDIAKLPYDDALIAWIERERSAGRSIVLCSASDETFVSQVADHLGLFDEVIASDGVTNVSAERKAAILVERFGAKNFDYAGNSRDDVPVWAQARRAVLVSPARACAARPRASPRSSASSSDGRAACAAGSRRCACTSGRRTCSIFLPLLASHRIEEVALIRSALLAFFAFGLCASSVYVLNDLMDLESDRHHPRKRLRAFASGLLSPQAGLWVCAALLLGALWIGWQVGPAFTVWLDIYLALTLLYTFLLKRKILVDALTLAALYTLRILAGGAAVGIWPGFWLLAFSLFLFLSLAFVKRYSEVSVQLRKVATARRGATT
jgi:phosphoserine phosphatase